MASSWIRPSRSSRCLPDAPRTLEQRIQDQVAEYNKLHAVGLTAVRHPGDSIDNYRMRKEMERRGAADDAGDAAAAARGTSAAIEQTLKSSGLSPDDGDALLRLGGMKMGVDGGFEGGFMREPYEEPYGEGGTFRGLQTMPPDRFNEMVKLYNRLGWRVFTHAVGDAAIDEVLAGYEAANADASIVGKRWGIEHAFIGRADHLPRMKSARTVSVAAGSPVSRGPSLVKYWGTQRAFLTTPVKMYLDAGLPVSGGTDSQRRPVFAAVGDLSLRDARHDLRRADGRGPEDLPRRRAADGDPQPLVPHVRGKREGNDRSGAFRGHGGAARGHHDGARPSASSRCG